MTPEWKSFDPGIVITAIGGIGTAFIAGIFAILSGRKKAKSDVQGTLNSSFQILIGELQEERTELRRILKEQGQQIAFLQRRAEVFEKALRDNGIDIPVVNQ